jgi:hypothetical protein
LAIWLKQQAEQFFPVLLPQLVQNFAPSGNGWRQAAQVDAAELAMWPHALQKFAPSSNWWPHAEHQ